MTNRASTPGRLQPTWEKLCAEYLPVCDSNSIWRFSRGSEEGDLEQGWKLHVSATILNAGQILQRIAPLLIESKVQFKAPRSLAEVLILNSGLLYPYSQVGKIITVYPRNDDEAVHLAKRLHKLTFRFRAPAVPFDLRFSCRSNVYYRYGAFTKLELERNARRIPAIMSPNGELMPDVRENPKPHWARDLLSATVRGGQLRETRATTSNSFRVVRALVQRGKGGVYQAIDLRSARARPCLLKEGRRHGELAWDGRDGAWRVRHEEQVLSRLSECGIQVPRVYSRFEVEGNVYLAMEFVEGESLHNLLVRQKRRLSVPSILSFGIDIATFLAQMHRAGWAWRDCKPKNLMVNADGHLVPIDFEGAEQIARPDPLSWGTAAFMPRASREQAAHSGLTDDLYALGSILFLLISGRMFDDAQPISIATLRRNVPLELRCVVESLLAIDADTRLTAETARATLTSILLSLKRERMTLAAGKAA